jgi:hypothetical protein
MPGVVKVTCKEWLGAGFYISPTLVLTNAHVACAPDETARIRDSDGKELDGKVVFRDEWLDIAKIEVSGATVKPLPIGDATLLRAGDSVLYIGAPLGFDFSLGQGTLAYVGRNMEGIAWLQLNAPVQHGNSGGPMLDMRGRVLGIISLKATRGEGIAFALPIEYAVPPSGEQAARWDALAGRVRKEDAEEQQKVLNRYQRPRLIDAVVKDRAIWALFLGPADADVHDGLVVQMSRRDGRTCLAHVRIEQWESLTSLDESKFREERWLGRGELGRNLQAMSGRVNPDECPEAMAGDEMTLVDGVEKHGKAKLDRALNWVPKSARSGGPWTGPHASEATRWRERFDEAWKKVALAEQKALGVAAADAGVSAPPAALRDVSDARAGLIDLERLASDQDVPPSWR